MPGSSYLGQVLKLGDIGVWFLSLVFNGSKVHNSAELNSRVVFPQSVGRGLSANGELDKSWNLLGDGSLGKPV